MGLNKVLLLLLFVVTSTLTALAIRKSERLWQRPDKGENKLNLKNLDRLSFFFFFNFT